MEQQPSPKKTKLRIINKQHHVPNNKLLHNLIVESESLCSRVRPEYLNSFFYNDHITSAQMAINRDLVFASASKIRYSHKDNFNQGCSTMKQCFDLMKSTRRFHLNSIQARNYRAKCKIIKQLAQQNSSQNQGQVAQNRRQKYYRNKKQQRESYLKEKSILSKMLSNSSVFCNITNNSKEECQEKVQSIEREETSDDMKQEIGQVQSKKKQQKQNSQKCFKKSEKSKNNIQLSSFRIQTKNKYRNNNQTSYQNMEKQAINIANSQLRYFLRKNGQFLVTPKLAKRDKHHQMTKSLSFNQACHKKVKNKQKIGRQTIVQETKYFDKEQLGQYLFKSNGIDKLERKLRMSYTEKGEKKHKHSAIIQAIQKGNYSKVQVELSLNPVLMLAKEPKNLNNLLHVCIMNNKQDIFLMILRKCRKRGIDLLIQKNKYGRSPIELGQILSFFKEKELLNQMSEIEQDRIRYAYNVIADLVTKK